MKDHLAHAPSQIKASSKTKSSISNLAMANDTPCAQGGAGAGNQKVGYSQSTSTLSCVAGSEVYILIVLWQEKQVRSATAPRVTPKAEDVVLTSLSDTIVHQRCVR